MKKNLFIETDDAEKLPAGGHVTDQDILRGMLLQLQRTHIETVRIRNNVVFFFWVVIVSLAGWIVWTIIILGSLASAFSGM